jgi:aryl-alcohol dehydrogenase-like predicted oxidoreductase
MKYRFLGKTGMKVSELSLGCMTFGREVTEEVSREILDRFVEVGGNFIDTADVYSLGVSEEIVGRWLKNKDRDDFIIATKESATRRVKTPRAGVVWNSEMEKGI